MRSPATRWRDLAPPRYRSRYGRDGASIANATLGICVVLLAVLGAGRIGGASPTVVRAQELGGYNPQPASGPPVPIAVAPPRSHPGADLRINDFHVHIPLGAPEPLRVVIALHGMGGAGEDFGRTIHAWTDAQGWVVVAPTFRYGDWRDPAQVTREASEHLPRMAAILDLLPEIAGLPVQSQVLLYGYSRGGQTANRFALAFPERVAGAALISSGTYTLPSAAFRGEGDATALRFPYGIANLSELVGRSFDAEAFTRVPFWIGVGARDSDPADVPHQWDPYIGDDRVERAQRFAAWLDEVGARAQVQVFPGVGHGEHEAVRAGAMGFLAGVK